MQAILGLPFMQWVVPILVILLVASLILKAAKGFVHFLLIATAIAVLMIYVMPHIH